MMSLDWLLLCYTILTGDVSPGERSYFFAPLHYYGIENNDRDTRASVQELTVRNRFRRFHRNDTLR